MKRVKGSGIFKFMVFAIIMAVISVQALSLADNAQVKSEGKASDAKHVDLMVGSGFAFVEGKDVVSLSDKGKVVYPTIYKKTLYVPLSVYEKCYGAAVSYDKKTKKITIVYKNSISKYTIGKKKYILNDVEKSLKNPPILIKGKAYVPVREVTKAALNKSVHYISGNRIIQISDDKIKNDKNYINDVAHKIGGVLRPTSTKDYIKSVNANIKSYEKLRRPFMLDIFTGDAVVRAPEMVTNSNSEKAADSAPAESKTNVQVEGVDEDDIVKIHKGNIFVADNKSISIYNKNLELQSILYLNSDIKKSPSGEEFNYESVLSMYVDDSRLVVISRGNVSTPGNAPVIDTTMVNKRMDSIRIYDTIKGLTVVDTYNISDLKSPKLLERYEMEGDYQQSRKSGSKLYLLTTKYSYGQINDDILPVYRELNSKEIKPSVRPAYQTPKSDSLYLIPENRSFMSLTTISVLDTQNTGSKVLQETWNEGSYGMNMYMDLDSIYLTTTHYDYSDFNFDEKTYIISFKIQDSGIVPGLTTVLKGNVLNQFSMNKRDGNFYIATSSRNEGNSLFILNDNMETIGKLEGLAKGERIYSVRYVGKMAYIVTFKNMDPLFVVDCTNPENPVLKGELKIPGFSNYLHPIGKDLLVGFGQDISNTFVKDRDGVERIIGNRPSGMKISLFNVSDPSKPIEQDSYYIGDSYTYAEVYDNHKALMVDSDNNYFGFSLNYSEKDKNMQNGFVLGVVDGKIVEKAKLPLKEGSYSGRFVYSGDNLYCIEANGITQYNYKTFEPIKSVIFEN